MSNEAKWIETVGAWGDSITYGACDEDARGWAGRLRRKVEHDHATEVYNFGVCGDTSADLLKRFGVELQGIKPGLVLIAIGTNDSRYRGGGKNNREVPIPAYIENLSRIFEAAKKATQLVYAVSPTLVHEFKPWALGEAEFDTEVLREYAEAMRATAQAQGVTFVDLFNLLTPDDLADGLHPNAHGYTKMYEAIHAAIRPQLS